MAGAQSSISGRLAMGAAKLLSGYATGGMSSDSTIEETSAMLQLVTKDRERLGHKLAAETELRKKLEAEKRELVRKLRAGSSTSALGQRKMRDVADELLRKKDELVELRQMLSHQTLEIAGLQTGSAAKDKRIAALEKKVGAYDDSFYSLEARNVRDRTRMEEMAKAKAKAEEEKNVFRLMLEQAHERGLKERMELRRDAQAKIESSAARVRTKKLRIAELEKQLTAKLQLEEEKNAYREQCSALMEQCSSLMEQLAAAHSSGGAAASGGVPVDGRTPDRADAPPDAPPSQQRGRPPKSPAHAAPTSVFDRVKSGMVGMRRSLDQGVAAAQAAAKEAAEAHAGGGEREAAGAPGPSPPELS